MVILVNPDKAGLSRAKEMLAAFRAGKDTLEIAKESGISEAVVYNQIHRARNNERLLSNSLLP